MPQLLAEGLGIVLALRSLALRDPILFLSSVPSTNSPIWGTVHSWRIDPMLGDQPLFPPFTELLSCIWRVLNKYTSTEGLHECVHQWHLQVSKQDVAAAISGDLNSQKLVLASVRNSSCKCQKNLHTYCTLICQKHKWIGKNLAMETSRKKSRPQIQSKWKVALSYSRNQASLPFQANLLML